MTTAARRHVHDQQPEHRALLTARVVLRHGEQYSLSLEEGGEKLARRAASCLLAPQPGDRVLLALTPEPFVVAVLERDGSEAAEVSVEGDLRIAPTGRLELSTQKTLSLLSRKLSVRSGSGEMVFNSLDAVAGKLMGAFDQATVIAKSCDTFVERITQRAKRCYRFVEELDQLRARHFDYRAEDAAQIKGKNTVITARQVAKMDGEQIHIG